MKMKTQMIAMPDGKRLYLESWLQGHPDTVVLLHGGPGEGCWPLRYFAGELSRHFNVLSFDQRGALRSEGLLPDEPFSVELMLDDIEQLRLQFGLGRIYLLGHSYGGELAVRFAYKYPQSLAGVICVCPAFNTLLSFKGTFAKAVRLAQQAGETQLAEQLGAATVSDNFDGLLEAFALIPQQLRRRIYRTTTPRAEVIACNDIEEREEEGQRCMEHQRRVTADGYLDCLPLLPQIAAPMLLVVGEDDSVCTPEQQLAFAKTVQNGYTVVLQGCAHAPHTECPERLTAEILDWYTSKK